LHQCHFAGARPVAPAEGYPVFPLKEISVCRTAYIESDTKDFDSGLFARRTNVALSIESSASAPRRHARERSEYVS
jgi:hypothetical protein